MRSFPPALSRPASITAAIAVLLVLLLGVADVGAQSKRLSDFEVRRICVQDGLTNPVVIAACPDTTGLLWVNTQGGVFTFDGFRVNRFDPVAPSLQLIDTWGTDLATDSLLNHLIFISTRSGTCIVDPYKQRCIPGSVLGLSDQILETCTQIEKGNGDYFWLLGDHVVYKLRKTGTSQFDCQPVYRLPWDRGLIKFRVVKLVVDAHDDSGVWLLPASGDALFVNAKGAHRFGVVERDDRRSPIPGLVDLLFKDNGVFAWDHARNIYRLDTDHGCFVNTGDRLNLYDFFPAMAGVDNFIIQKPNLKFCTQLWGGQQLFGTSLGLFFVRKKISGFKVIEPLRGEEIRGIYTDSSGRWCVGTYNGVYVGNQHRSDILQVKVNGVWNFLPLNPQYCLLAVERPSGLALWDIDRNRHLFDSSMVVPLKPSSDVSALALCRDSAGTLWAGTYGRILFAPPVRPYRFRALKDPRTGGEFQLQYARALVADPQSGVWVGAENGLFRIRLNTARNQYELDTAMTCLQGVFISGFYRDRFNHLWVATKGKGIACLDLNSGNKIVHWYDTTDGLCNDFTCRIEGSNDDRVLWISTHNGLTRLDVTTGVAHNFYEESGFPGNEFNSAASARFPDGTLFFGGVSGLIGFHPDSILVPDFQYKTMLKFASVYGSKSGTTTRIYLNPETGISLQPYPEFVEFQLGATEYTEPDKVRFRYRMHGLSELWTYTSGEHEVKFARLAPGTYTLEVQAIPFVGHFGKTVQLLVFVATPFYETFWFRALLLAAIIGIAYGAYQYRLRQILKEQRIRRQIADDLHDDIGNKLNIISILAQKAARNMPPADSGSLDNSLAKLVEISRETLTSLYSTIWSIDPNKDHLKDLLNRMQDFADDYLRPLNIQCAFSLPIIPNMEINLNARHHILLIYQELLTNMVKHTSPKRITTNIRLINGNYLEIVLVNECQGTAGQAYATFSLQRGQGSLERRLRQINGQIQVVGTDSGRQQVRITIPNIGKT